MLCLKPDQAFIQGQEYFNIFSSVRFTIRFCNDRNNGLNCISADEQTHFWQNAGIAVHTIENNIDLTDRKMEGKPSQSFNLLRLIPLTSKKFVRRNDVNEEINVRFSNQINLEENDYILVILQCKRNIP